MMSAICRSGVRTLPALGWLALLLAAGAGWSATSPQVFTVADLGDLGGGSAVAYGVNNAGQVVGESSTASGAVHAFRWSADAGMVDLSPAGGGTSVAYGI